MPVNQGVLIAIFGILILLVAVKLFTAPMRWAFKAALNTALGFVGLFLFNLIGQSFGLSLGLNLLNAAVIGVLGLPGFELLLMLQWLFR